MTQNTKVFDLNAERALLGCLLISSETLKEVKKIIQQQDIHDVRHQWVYEAILYLYDHDESVDLITVASRLETMGKLKEVGGEAYLTELVAMSPDTFGVSSYARIIHEKSIRRKLEEAGREIMMVSRSSGDISDLVKKAYDFLRVPIDHYKRTNNEK